MDENKLMEFVHKAVGDVGSLLAGSMVVIGDRLGLYRAMADGKPITSRTLAERTGTSERYVREWLGAQAAQGFLRYEGEQRYSLPVEHAVALTDEDSPAFVAGAFQVGLAAVRSTDRMTEAFRTGEGIGWGEHDHDLYPGTERFFRPNYLNYLAQEWIPALDGFEARLSSGIRVLDLGCGHGASTILMGTTYPASTFLGTDPHPASVEEARKRAAETGVSDRVKFEVGTAQQIDGTYDLVTFFDCLHDMGRPDLACEAVRDVLAPDGAVLVVEPRAGDTIEENLNPIGAVYYAASTLLCTPNAISQNGEALGAQAGEARIREVFQGAGFGDFRRIAETPFNMVYAARR
jgi:SAM-dependent methyltransferase